MQNAFIVAMMAGKLARGKNPLEVVRQPIVRGMNFIHDVHDWLGGYPHETATIEELSARVCQAGFEEACAFRSPVGAKGLFGSGCRDPISETGLAIAVLTQPPSVAAFEEPTTHDAANAMMNTNVIWRSITSS